MALKPKLSISRTGRDDRGPPLALVGWRERSLNPGSFAGCFGVVAFVADGVFGCSELSNNLEGRFCVAVGTKIGFRKG